MYLKAIKALRPNLKDRLELLIKHKKLKRNSGTFSKKVHAINIPQLSSSYSLKPSALLISLRKPLKSITANGKENRREKPRKVATLLNTTHRPTKERNKITIDNSTRPGRININAINRRRFNRTCNTYGKKGHKEADYRSKMTCGFCGKKGHDKTHYYTKKNAKKPKTPKDKAQIDTIMEIPHNYLS
ncbi:LOW QUALITY PROTEIN: hypothetical protein MKX08_007589 [Trichoderma sp. CBMAI-0020]|nr:LOW QUALITY PROTEIN: hypothetical protein MKX08_007589 [Trichoderma sp. CBMAI-0020]